MIRRPPRSPLFPYTPLSRSADDPPQHLLHVRDHDVDVEHLRLQHLLAAEGEELLRERRRPLAGAADLEHVLDRKSTRLNSSHSQISYAVFCLKKKKQHTRYIQSNAGAITMNISHNCKNKYMISTSSLEELSKPVSSWSQSNSLQTDFDRHRSV